MKLPRVLPDAFLRCMSADDRQTLAGGQHTHAEAVLVATAKTERELQTQIVGLLRLRSIEPLWFRTDKRSRATIGWPDITFAVHGRAYAWEVKLPDQQPRSEQVALHCLLMRNGWTVEVVRSVDDARKMLSGYIRDGLETASK